MLIVTMKIYDDTQPDYVGTSYARIDIPTIRATGNMENVLTFLRKDWDDALKAFLSHVTMVVSDPIEKSRGFSEVSDE